MNRTIHIASFVVAVKPECLQQAKNALTTLRGVEVAQEDRSGKLIVLIETDSDAGVAKFIDTAHQLTGVVAVSFVYHQRDSEEAFAREIA